MNQPNPLSLPTKQPPREYSISIRLSAQEREALNALAKRLSLPASQLARHLLMQLVVYHLRNPQAATSSPTSDKGA